MKATRSPKAKQVASALLVALSLTTVLSLSVVGYLTVVEQQNMLGARSQSWNMSIAVVEAGIEEGLEQLNCNKSNLSADGWQQSGNYFTMTRTMPDGNTYNVKINNTDPNNPIVTCLGNVTPPTWVRNTLGPCFAAMGTTTPAAPVQRAVQVRTSRGNLFLAALVAKRGIDMNGNGVYTDSYDSTDATKSTGGQYDSTKYSGNHGDVACNAGVTNSGSVSVGNANIYGIIHTGPQCPVAFLPNGGVGPHGAQVNDVATAKNLGYILEDANFTYPDTSLPSDYASYLPPTSGTVVTWSNNIVTTPTNSTVPPAGTPWGGVLTNNNPTWSTTWPGPLSGLSTNSVLTNVTAYPGPIAGLITNAPSAVTNTTSPAAGTYLGSVTSKKISGTWYYTYYPITGYSYYLTEYGTPHYSYLYSLYATNTIYFTNSYNYVLNSNTKYQASSVSGNIIVTGPNTVLVLPNGLTGAENFTFTPGASVLVYSGGTSCTINGNQYLNPNSVPASFIVYCTPSVTTFALNGNGQFTGVLVAPNANIKMNGGGKSNEDFCGCLMVNSATMNGHFSFHYDESLSHMPSNGRFLISGWDEIDPKTF